MIYLDYQATTPLAPEVFAAMEPWLKTEFANPHSVHAMGRAAAAAVEVARAQVAALLPKGGRVIFTSGATEAIKSGHQGLRVARDRSGHRTCGSAGLRAIFGWRGVAGGCRWVHSNRRYVSSRSRDTHSASAIFRHLDFARCERIGGLAILAGHHAHQQRNRHNPACR